MTQPHKYDVTSERRTIWLWKESPLRHLHPSTQPRNTTSPQNEGPYDYEKTLRDATCMRWLYHANVTSPTIWLWKCPPRLHLHLTTQPCKYDITSKPWRCSSLKEIWICCGTDQLQIRGFVITPPLYIGINELWVVQGVPRGYMYPCCLRVCPSNKAIKEVVRVLRQTYTNVTKQVARARLMHTAFLSALVFGI